MKCPNCGNENRSDAAFCDACGTRLESEPQPARARPLPTVADGRYVARAFLGEGGRKQVYRALDTRLDREVALSLIRTAGLDDASIERVRREAKAMAKLGDHPNIVNIFDVGEEEGVIFLIAELMPGGSVEEQLNQYGGPLPTEQVTGIGRDVAGALQYVHEQGIVHRDIKPANVWLSRDGRWKLGDFGLAAGRHTSKLTTEGMMLGTVAYMAPEQATGGEVDGRSDLYSFGALLYEAATGKPPFAGDDAVAIISQQINTAPVAPTWHNAQIPLGLEALILQLLAKSPDERPQTAAEVLTRLEQIGDTDATPAQPAPVRQENQLDRLASGVFVGREAESQQLRLMFDDARRGNGAIALLVGEPGIGKTRMSEELITYARMNGGEILTGRCYEGEGAPAYWPWIQIIRSSVSERPANTLASELGSGAGYVAQIVPDIKQVLPEVQSPASGDSESSRFQLFDSVTTFLRNHARARPLVVFLDDIHWADKPSLLLLEFLSRQLRGSSILVVCAYRDIELGRQHPLAQTLASLIREPNARRILLRGLAREDVARYIKLTIGREPPDSLVDAIQIETEGNPFFVIETVRLLAAEGRLDEATKRSWSITIPQGVKEVIGRRLDQLSEECNEVLTLASVVGREFELPMIELLSSLPADVILEALDEAVAARVVTAAPNGRYRFAHALIRETLYGELSTAKRLRLHKSAAEALEKLSGDDVDRHLTELAHHYFEASALGEVEKAILYARRAGERSMHQLAFEEAAVHFDRALQALDLAEAVPEEQRCDLLLALGHAQVSSGEASSALKTYRSAFELATRGRLIDHAARAALGVGDVLTDVRAVSQELVETIQEALELNAGHETPLRVRLLARLAEAYRFDVATKHKESELAIEALAMARRLGDPQATAQALYARIVSLGEGRETETQLSLATELIDVAHRAGDVERKLLGLRLRPIFYFQLNRIPEARRDVSEYARLAERAKLPLYTWFAPLMQSAWSFGEGRLTEASELIERAIHDGTKAGDPNVKRFSVGAEVAVATELQDLDRLRDLIERLREPNTFRWLWAAHIMALTEAGEIDEARRLVDGITSDRFQSVNMDFGIIWAMGALAEVCRRLGHLPGSNIVYEVVSPMAGRFGVPGYVGPSSGCGHHHLGVLATTLGRYEDARYHLDAALGLHQKAGFQYLVTQTRLAQARLYSLRNGTGDAERCRILVNEVIEAAQRGGFKRTLEEALALRLQLQSVDRRDTGRSIGAIAGEIGPDSPDVTAAPDGTVTILFTDIESSTELTEKLGDKQWLSLLQAHDRIVRAEVAKAGGSVVKSRGDGFMLAFPSARQALNAAIAAQKALARHNATSGGAAPIRIRIGVHTGEVVKQSGDIFGRHVNYASRIADQAAGGEILVSELTQALVQGSLYRFGEVRSAMLKGFPGNHRMFVLDWESPAGGTGDAAMLESSGR